MRRFGPVALDDGLYQVESHLFVAGFIVRGGWILEEDCAPVLRSKLRWWTQLARRVGP